jgi:hypothetical protein
MNELGLVLQAASNTMSPVHQRLFVVQQLAPAPFCGSAVGIIMFNKSEFFLVLYHVRVCDDVYNTHRFISNGRCQSCGSTVHMHVCKGVGSVGSRSASFACVSGLGASLSHYISHFSLGLADMSLNSVSKIFA